MGQLLLDYPLSYALTTIVDVLVVYLQQFWKTVSKVPDTKDTIKFKLDKQDILYAVDMFRSTLQLPVETTVNPFIAPATMKFIQPFMKIIGYQGVVDKVSAFYTKCLAQSWKTMIKVFSRCLTTRTSRHDQTKINILYIFHVVVNRVHVDYVALLWWDFLNCILQKKDVIQYPRFTKLVIANLMKKFDSIPPRLEEDYHSLKDDILLVSVYSTGNVIVQGMLIPDEFITNEIRATKDYKEYEQVFVRVDVPTFQPQPVVSTQGTHMTKPSAHRSPAFTTDIAPKKKKRKQVARETSSPRKSLKFIIKQKKPSTTPIPPPSDDRDRDEIAKATLLSLALHKTAITVEAQSNVQEKLKEDGIAKMVKGDKDEESYASEFDDSMLNDDDDSNTRIDPGGHKEHLKNVDDDD
ncbi:hypothetical protein Tco_0304566 [Tanacetum coccineum]